ncbi:MAG: hypothetical protein CVU61_00235 [Deltaproteobacteria bacterium HGW-Deltaproteobacteria-19]|jgi:alkylhydroperoxidase/carboxymuconolactone decarboxylase family protein YurZ|nr:MAG: hypothetical protein CVU61_00235 [Deltaproteobacteria bacterium HGW-Deltaproteobacteria-19]
MEKTERVMSDGEKTLVALGAAIGGGCEKCAENLFRIADGQGVTAEELMSACRIGFEAKSEAVRSMKDRLAGIMKGDGASCDESRKMDVQKLAAMIRAAAFAAANAAPDATGELKKAFKQGAGKGDFRMCLSIVKTIREKAASFSDQDILEKMGNLMSDGRRVDKEAGSACCTGASCGCN